MFSGEFDYTVCSTNPDHYNRINCCLSAPITKYCSMTVTALTAKCSIVVLNENDYVMINGKQYCLGKDYIQLGDRGYAQIMNEYFEENNIGIQFNLDEVLRLEITSSRKFVIERVTYNVSLLIGLYNTSFPIYSDSRNTDYGIQYYIKANSVGYCLSTPKLYLTSNVGIQSYRNDIIRHINMTGSKIVMRLNNSFNPGDPIITNNADFSTTILSNDLSNLEFTLVDGFLKEIKLLSPMYLSIHVSGIKDDVIMSDSQLMITNSQSR